MSNIRGKQLKNIREYRYKVRKYVQNGGWITQNIVKLRRKMLEKLKIK
jgi:hypothetical protein